MNWIWIICFGTLLFIFLLILILIWINEDKIRALKERLNNYRDLTNEIDFIKTDIENIKSMLLVNEKVINVHTSAIDGLNFRIEQIAGSLQLHAKTIAGMNFRFEKRIEKLEEKDGSDKGKTDGDKS